MWLIDPESREPLPAYPEPEPLKHPTRYEVERDPDTNLPIRMRWVPCRCDECEAEWAFLKANVPELRRRLIAANRWRKARR